MTEMYILRNKVVTRTFDEVEWARQFKDFGLRRVASNRSGTIHVSTVFLGTNHNFHGGPPLLFETMVFADGDECYCNRYETYEEAVAGHAEACRIYLPVGPGDTMEQFIHYLVELA